MPAHIRAAQQAIQAAKGHVHLKGSSMDKITSVVIPLGFTVAAMGLLTKGLDDLSWGKNRKEGF
ncbi:predicted protein [Micromonas commoda]|uniref:Uncharacterized protein n=1 Tax=Micromonas commoda (strain RCC299 / NOUM17 / CCMP2709) TaxID=296587 RepID=C1EG43_MICCC|nr:predicted protein [Micromonas commoda]ACO66958.1 predicted protein [Micromonas commoda]|eukprot:XP_002505700.1 predicted protein [Micromonas commoda]